MATTALAFGLYTPADMVAKLRREFSRMEGAHRYSADHAINFFVTAEHIPEWLSPPNRDMREDYALLRVVSHIANGAKHRQVNRHEAVVATGLRGGYFAASYFAPRYFGGLASFGWLGPTGSPDTQQASA